MNLTGATIGAIDLSHNWPDKIYMNGLTYRNLSKPRRELQPSSRLKPGSATSAYTPQPYEQLASVLQSNGWIADATAIRYAGKEQEQKKRHRAGCTRRG